MYKNLKSPVMDHRRGPKHPDPDAVLACATGLWRTSLTGSQQRPLKGQNLGLLCDDECIDAVEAFRGAAAELGANVAIIRSDLASASATQKIGDIARLLSRLYDAVECNGLPDEVVEQLAQAASIPVGSGHIATTEQVDALARRLEGTDTWEQKRRSVLQALVMQSVC